MEYLSVMTIVGFASLEGSAEGVDVSAGVFGSFFLEGFLL